MDASDSEDAELSDTDCDSSDKDSEEEMDMDNVDEVPGAVGDIPDMSFLKRTKYGRNPKINKRYA